MATKVILLASNQSDLDFNNGDRPKYAQFDGDCMLLNIANSERWQNKSDSRWFAATSAQCPARPSLGL